MDAILRQGREEGVLRGLLGGICIAGIVPLVAAVEQCVVG